MQFITEDILLKKLSQNLQTNFDVKVNQKLKIFCIIGILNLIIFSSSFSLIGKAETEHDIGFNEGTELIWEITELNLEKYRDILGIDPNYEVGEQTRMIIREIDTSSEAWILKIEFWDYKTDWNLGGEESLIYIGNSPEDWDDKIFCLTPVEDYLEQVITTLTSEYYRTGLSIFKRANDFTGKDYLWEKEFDPRGLLVVETYYDESDEDIIIRWEGQFRIVPFGITFVGFAIFAIIAIIGVSIKKKNPRIVVY